MAQRQTTATTMSEEAFLPSSSSLSACENAVEASIPLSGDEPPQFEAFQTPGLYQSLVQAGRGTRVVPYKKDSSEAEEDYSKLFDANGYCENPGEGKAFNVSDNQMPDMSFGRAGVQVTNGKSAASSTSEEEKPPTYPLQFEDSVEISFAEKVVIYPTRVIDRDDEESEGEQMGEADESEKVKKENMRNWAYVNFSGMRDKETSRFLRKLIKMCVNIGMDFLPLPRESTHVTSCCPESIEKTLLLMDFNLARDFSVGENQIGLLIVFLPDCTHSHDKVEEVCRSLGIVYQCFSSKDVWGLDKEYLEAVALEINKKVIQRHDTGVQQPLVHRGIPFVSEAPTVIFGADVSRSAQGEGSISIASVVASMDWPGASKYRALVSYQPYTELAIKDLFNPEKDNGGIFSELLLAFHEKCKQWPERIIFFRNGGTGGLFPFSGHHTFSHIFVVVAERPSTGSQVTCEAVDGSEFGDDSCIPINFEFSITIYGEGTTMRYSVFNDENHFTPHQFESLCNNLHTLRIRLTYPKLSVVPPSYFAQEAASRACNYAKNHTRLTSTNPEERDLPKYLIP